MYATFDSSLLDVHSCESDARYYLSYAVLTDYMNKHCQLQDQSTLPSHTSVYGYTCYDATMSCMKWHIKARQMYGDQQSPTKLPGSVPLPKTPAEPMPILLSPRHLDV